MNRNELIQLIRLRKSFLCVGLDTDREKIPDGISILDFNKKIIDATRDLCVAYKPNLAFYECLGPHGWEILDETVKYIGNEHFTIADAKRGDIGNTSNYYAKTFFEKYNFDSVTVAPYMGRDSVEPFLKHTGKWAIILALTSNPGADNFEMKDVGALKLFEEVLGQSSNWGNEDNTMYVIGATRAEMLRDVRKIVPHHFLLVPGVGAQGGSLQEVAKYGMTKDCGLLVNASRSILYASSGKDFVEAARSEAKKIQQEMAELLEGSV
ncbi:MAG: orotidine-5'-phosphate decarboxylase [Flavobacteriales bacterium]|nr:orotidine-5'-phosphate decarboxylase [Flavobacteriales bacterium]